MVANRKYYQGIDFRKNSIQDFAITFADNTASVGVITDSRTTATGIEYAADYSSNYTNRSLVDKGYVDGLIAAADALTFQGGLDASGVNQLPAGDAGDFYKITVAGNFNGTTASLRVGQAVICTTDATSANTPANWIFLESDYELATTTVAGVVVLADGTDVAAGTGNDVLTASLVIDEDTMSSNTDQKVPTQQSVKAYVDSSVSGLGTVSKYSATSLAIGPTANAGSPVTVNHALGSLAVIVQVFDGTTEELIDVAVDRTDANNITLDSSEDITVDVVVLA